MDIATVFFTIVGASTGIIITCRAIRMVENVLIASRTYKRELKEQLTDRRRPP